jgi:spermidine synthase
MLKYQTIENIVAIDIDGEFVELAKKHFPDKTISFNDPRVELLITDGAEYIKTTNQTFDTIAATVGDPFTVSKTLFNKDFVRNCFDHLSDHGILNMDGYMPYYTHDDSLNYWDIFKLISDVFPIVRVATSTSPLMPGGLCVFIYGSKTEDPSNPPARKAPYQSSWYNEKIHAGSFALPQMIREKLANLKGFVQ